MKKTSILLILLLIAVCVKAQTPEWQWAISIGGSEWDEGRGITTDDAGNVYVTGAFTETATFGPYSLTSNGDWDIFVAKMDANGNWLWAIQPDESSIVDGLSITIDDSGNVYVVGSFQESLIFGSYSLISNGDSDAFIVKIDTNGNWLWANSYGGSESESIGDITIDDSGSIYISGKLEDPVTSNSVPAAKLDANGNWLWGFQAGENRSGRGIATDNTGNIYIIGTFQETVTFGSYSLTSYGETDMFVVMMDADGNCQWAVQAGGSYYDSGRGITSDNAGNIYIIGRFIEAATFGTQYIEGNGFYNAFVAKIDVDGNWQWITQPDGGDNLVHPNGISTDNIGNIYITGAFVGVAEFGSDTLMCYGEDDIFVAKMEANGNWLWGAQAGGCNYDSSKDLTIDSTEKIYITGMFPFTATFGSHTIESNGVHDAYVAKLSCNTDISGENANIPALEYLSNYPNPFQRTTTISFSVRRQEMRNPDVVIYNIKGQLVRKLENVKKIDNCNYSVVWDGKNNKGREVENGVYFCTLLVGNNVVTKEEMLLIK